MDKGKEFRAWREKHGLSQEKIARITGASYGTVKNWEKNIGPGPTIENIRALCSEKPGLLEVFFPDASNIEQPITEGPK